MKLNVPCRAVVKAKRDACEKEITELRRHSAVRKNPEDEVAAMVKLTEKLHLLAEDACNLPALGELFNTQRPNVSEF